MREAEVEALICARHDIAGLQVSADDEFHRGWNAGVVAAMARIEGALRAAGCTQANFIRGRK